MHIRRDYGRHVYIFKTETQPGNAIAITVYGTFLRANKALHKRMTELIQKGKYTETEIKKIKENFINTGTYRLKNEKKIIEKGFIEITKVH